MNCAKVSSAVRGDKQNQLIISGQKILEWFGINY